jgi:hypothetical protein
VARWRPRPGPTPMPGWPVERRPACRAGLVPGFFGPPPPLLSYRPDVRR